MSIAFISLAALAVALAGLVLFTRATAGKVIQVVRPLGRVVDVGGTPLHVHEEGHGPALLLVHGLGGQMRHFTHGLSGLLRDRYRVVMVDRPGSGHSPRADATPADLKTQAAVLAQLIDQLRLERPVVVGHSLGGALALQLALDYPDKVGGLALLAPLTHLADEAEVPAAFRALTIKRPWLRKLFAWTVATPGTIAGSRKVLGQVFGPDPVPRDFPVKGGGLLSLRPGAFIAASRDMQALPDSVPGLMARYGNLRLPVAVLYGAGDRILDWQANGQALVRLVPGATLQVIDAGHMLPVTHATQCARLIDEVAQRVAAVAH